MRLGSLLCALYTFLFPLVLHGEVISCAANNKDICEVVMEGDNQYVYLRSAREGRMFARPEERTAMEDFSLFKQGGEYSFLMESFDSEKSKILMTFPSDASSLSYLYLTSEPDFKLKKKRWSGFYCGSHGNNLPRQDFSPFEWAFHSACSNLDRSRFLESKYIGEDFFFSMPRIDGASVRNMKLVALDAGRGDDVSIFDFGCIENCRSIVGDVGFTGRIKSTKIKLFLIFRPETVEGYYYYDKYKEKITIEGKLSKEGRLDLYAKNKSGDVVEEFGGVVSGGLFSGKWTSYSSGKVYPFSLYLMII